MNESVIQPKAPTGADWKRASWWRAPPALVALGYPVHAWMHGPSGLFVLSAVEVAAAEPGGEARGPEYHVSLSQDGRRCDSATAQWVLGEFDLTDATEDNHVPHGIVRNFWRPVADRLSGYECPCVDEEPAISEDKGDFVWRGVTR